MHLRATASLRVKSEEDVDLFLLLLSRKSLLLFLPGSSRADAGR